MPFDQPPFPSTFDVGTPGAGHIHFGSDGTMTLFGPDGVTPIATLTPATGLLLAGQKYLQLATGDPAEGPLPAEIFAQNSPADNVTPNRRPVLELVGSSANSSGDVLPGVFIFGKSYDLTVPSEIQLHAHSTSIFAEAGATTTRVLLLSNDSTVGGVLSWDGSTFSIAGQVTVTTPGDLRLNHAGASPGLVTSGGFGGLRGFFIPGSSEQSLSITPAGVITLGNGSTTIGGSVNIRNPSAAALTQRTLTLQPVGSQTGDIVTVVDPTNTNIWWRLQSDGSMSAPKGVKVGNNTVSGPALWGGTGAPATGLGTIGDIYFRLDTPTTALQRIYIKTAAAVWTGIS